LILTRPPPQKAADIQRGVAPTRDKRLPPHHRYDFNGTALFFALPALTAPRPGPDAIA